MKTSIRPLQLMLLWILMLWMGMANAQSQGQISRIFSPEAGGKRSFFVSLPHSFSSTKTYKLLLVFPGTDTSGQEMKEWLGDGWNGPRTSLEANLQDTIVVYPDPNWHDFPGFDGRFRGWLLGPNSLAESGYRGERPGAPGNDPVRDSYIDINFTRELLEWLTTESSSRYKIDPGKVFVTGHSWGGDMAAVAGCFIGRPIQAVAPVAANRPYWFHEGGRDSGSLIACKDPVAVWTFFGIDEDFFEQTTPPGDLGIQHNDFWKKELGCHTAPVALNVGVRGKTTEYRDCERNLRFTLYRKDYSGGGDLPGHYPPDTFAKAISIWFAGF